MIFISFRTTIFTPSLLSGQNMCLFYIFPNTKRFLRLLGADILLLQVGRSCRKSVMQHQTSMTGKIKYGELKLSLSNKVNKGE